VVKSVGFGIYKLKSKINTLTVREIVKKKSNTELGRGIIIIKSIAKTNATTPKSVISLIALKDCLSLFTSTHPYNI